MPRNVEIKARLSDATVQREIASSLCRGMFTVIQQTDVFFECPTGRLKLRIFDDQTGELISYQRADETGPKVSHYRITPTPNPDSLRATLASALGELAVVRKIRHLYLWQNTRIHLDQVDQLGDYLELEVVLDDDATIESGEAIANVLMEKLQITSDMLVRGAYVDFLMSAN